MFHIIEDAYAIVRNRGVFKQVKVYRRKSGIYVGYGSGYIRVMRHGTTAPNVQVDEIFGVDYEYNRFGRAVEIEE